MRCAQLALFVASLAGKMVVEGKQTSHDSTRLCQRRGNKKDPRTDPEGPEAGRNAAFIVSSIRADVVRNVGWGDGGEEGLVCLEPPGSTYPDSVQIVDDTIKHSPKQVHTLHIHKQNPPRLRIVSAPDFCSFLSI